jgi:sugar/nucleoside kinase (ribokinase family)
VKNQKDAEQACQKVLAREGFYLGVVITLGANGCVFGEKKSGSIKHFPAQKVQVVDTTVNIDTI